MSVLITRLGVEVSYSSDDSPVRVTRTQMSAVYADKTNPIRVSREQIAVMYADRTNPIRVSTLLLQLLHSVTNIIPPTPDRPALPRKEREPNPYRATLPLGTKVDPEVATFMRTQQEHVREQHNVTQMGDSTFSWEWLTKLSPTPAYTLGSLARFFHDDFGIILARYVRFTSMVENEWINVPAGRLKSSSVVDWKVTNDYSISGPMQVAGIIASYTQPQNGDYGWLITCGANIVPLPYLSQTVLAQETELVWSATGFVGPGGVGQTLARVLKDDGLAPLPAGSCFINLEGLTTASYIAALAPRFDTQQGLIDDLTTRLALLEHLTGVDGITADLAAITEDVESLQTGLAAEIAKRVSDVKALSDRINAIPTSTVSQADLDALAAALYAQTRALIAPVNQKAQSALDKIAAINIDSLKQQIKVLADAIAALAGTSSGVVSYIPVVVGFPPILVYDEDGQLILTEGPNG